MYSLLPPQPCWAAGSSAEKCGTSTPQQSYLQPNRVGVQVALLRNAGRQLLSTLRRHTLNEWLLEDARAAELSIVVRRVKKFLRRDNILEGHCWKRHLLTLPLCHPVIKCSISSKIIDLRLCSWFMSIMLINILIQLRLRNVDGLNLLILKLCKPIRIILLLWTHFHPLMVHNRFDNERFLGLRIAYNDVIWNCLAEKRCFLLII